MFLTHSIQLFYDALLAVAYPESCAICASSVEARRFGVVCETCWRKTRVFTGRERLCWKCGAFLDEEVLPIPLEDVRCGRCETQCFDVARAVGPYDGALLESVLQLKREPHVASNLEALL